MARTSQSDDTPAPDAAQFSRRSWYMPADAAERLQRAVNDLHFETRLPKGQLLGLVVDTALRHLDEVRDAAQRSGRAD